MIVSVVAPASLVVLLCYLDVIPQQYYAFIPKQGLMALGFGRAIIAIFMTISAVCCTNALIFFSGWYKVSRENRIINNDF